MRRILAALAAVAMLAAGFAVRQSLDDPQRGKEPLALACVAEAMDACRAIERATVTELSPAAIEKALVNATGDAPFDAVVTVSPWPERLAGTAAIRPRSDVGLVSSPVVVARRAAAPNACQASLSCLVGLNGRVAFPSVGSTTAGAIIAAATMASGGVDADDVSAETDKAEALLADLRDATDTDFPLGPIGTLTSGGSLLDAAVDVQASIPRDVAGLVVNPTVPATVIQLRMLGFIDDERLAAAESTLRSSLLGTGWSADSGVGIPPVPLMSATYDRLKG